MNEKERPTIFGMSVARKADTLTYLTLPEFPITAVHAGTAPLTFDRNISFGYARRLNYKAIVNWVIAEHKSQGAMQLGMNDGDREVFWFFEINAATRYAQATKLFDDLAKLARRE
ncbi:MAG: hypothetical protein NTV54_04870 [Ignavibacteriales bacterium]|nr:hypothetical protein [Ignavibacteriales bacterium]